MSEPFDIATLGPGWQPYKSRAPLERSNLDRSTQLAFRVPTEVGTRTIVGFYEHLIGDQVTVELKSGARVTYSEKHIVAVVYCYQRLGIR